MLLLWLCLVAGVRGLIPVDNDVEPEYTVATDDDESSPSDNFVIFTVATEANDPFQRYVRSLKVFDMDQHLQVHSIGYIVAEDSALASSLSLSSFTSG